MFRTVPLANVGLRCISSSHLTEYKPKRQASCHRQALKQITEGNEEKNRENKDKERKGRGTKKNGRTLSFYIGDRRGLVWPYRKSFMGGEGWLRGLHKKYLIMGRFQYGNLDNLDVSVDGPDS